jgi:GntR family transcriptional regulator/MocR family aminotransferase
MILLDAKDSLPLYRQLYDRLRARILTGQLPAHARLPSVREMVHDLGVSRNTVQGAYQELYAEGYIYSAPRSGYFVSSLDQDAAQRSLKPASHAPELQPEPAAGCRFDLHPARLDPGSFPGEIWRKCFIDSLRKHRDALVAYGDPQGELPLRRELQRYLERSRGVVCEVGQIVILAGLQQGLDLVAHLLRDSHRVVAVEDPGYFMPRAVFGNHGFQVLPVPVGPAGLDLEQLAAGAGSIAYVTPSHQLPLGCVMPVASRLKLIEWAESGGRFIIEDDYDSELRYHGKPIASLQGLRPDGNIIYSGTFSKVLSPALRISYLVLPRVLLAAYRRQFRDHFCTVSLLEQQTLARFMELGHWERHLRRMRTCYKRKHDRLLRAVEDHFGPRARVTGQGAGLHVVVQLVGAAPGEAELLRRAAREGLRLYPASDFYLAHKPQGTTLLLGFGAPSLEEIDAAVALLSRICA